MQVYSYVCEFATWLGQNFFPREHWNAYNFLKETTDFRKLW